MARIAPADYDPEAALGLLARRHPARGAVVVGQLGQSLDGRIATPTGQSKYINGLDALRHLHRLRARADAVVIGVGTAVADDPRLTTRHVPGANPARVVIDPHGRMPCDLAMLSDGAAPVIAVGCAGAPVPAGAERLTLGCAADGTIGPGEIVAALAARGMRRILIEGGANTLARFIGADAIDELHLMIAPMVIGSGTVGLNLSPIANLEDALRPRMRSMRFRDGDMLCICDMAAAAAERSGAEDRAQAAGE